MNVGRKVLPATDVFHEFDGFKFQVGREIDHDVKVAVELHPVLGGRRPHFGHHDICRGPPSGGLAGLPPMPPLIA
ncbi:hypothetical protein [Bradyrhizobium canariense]|uniref:hypothetical protein n=1 Tax=Bradyrhizobium canariense TaxID=255045 RepID=UPI000A192969|nr:hypothetical protein [Bradyrhizobium canariense]OSI27422.1 hypothetical protein BST66_34955 [Bradyrhizobium canariense]OSI35007.1 hypothetical protein BST65_01415 [Bradyrhizobium canariense]OSI38997.1 hypothetical protein BSZ20_31350 [Bradyrhizobium canariense]OSI43121.1 hypothetical protein BST67_33930 [Bradyrhizobium canariense]OSI58410.1 hypothetical protein BSZ15_09990 [Bradyrhizobium canariense]